MKCEELLGLWREYLCDPICGVEEFKKLAITIYSSSCSALFFIGKLKQYNIRAEEDCLRIWIQILQKDDWTANVGF